MRSARVAFFVLLCALCSCGAVSIPGSRDVLHTLDWSPVEDVLNAAIADGAFPGCVAVVGDAAGSILFQSPFGSFTYGEPAPATGTNPKMTMDTMFDMASCTKVLSTTAAVAQFYERGELKLETKVGDSSLLGEAFNNRGKEAITVRHCLLHSAGFPPDPSPNYWSPSFGCPQTSQPHPKRDFSCQEKIFNALLQQSLAVPPDTNYTYSDISMFSLMYVVGKLAKDLGYVDSSSLLPGCDRGSDSSLMCYFEAYVRKYVFSPLGMNSTKFVPSAAEAVRCAPCENDTAYLRRVIQGEVSDGNAFASGGIQGHAGLFSTAPDVAVYARQWMLQGSAVPVLLEREEQQQREGALRVGRAAVPRLFSDDTIRLFRKEFDHSFSSRALGWNTNDPEVFDYGWDGTCAGWSSSTFLHLGYTGTQLCIDPEAQLFTVLLTNRVYPTDQNTKILKVRKLYNEAVQKVLRSL